MKLSYTGDIPEELESRYLWLSGYLADLAKYISTKSYGVDVKEIFTVVICLPKEMLEFSKFSNTYIKKDGELRNDVLLDYEYTKTMSAPRDVVNYFISTFFESIKTIKNIETLDLDIEELKNDFKTIAERTKND